MNSKTYYAILLTLVSYSSALNILGIFPYQGKSHFFVFKTFLEELATKGHNVVVISHFPQTQPHKNYQDVSLAGSVKIMEDDMPLDTSYKTILQTSLFLTMSGVENCEILLENKAVQKLWKRSPKFDVILVEQFNSDCALGLAYKLGAPVVGVTSHILMPWHYKRLGVPYNPSYVPFHFLEGGTKPTLYERVERVIFDAIFNTLYKYITVRSDQNTLAKYFNDIPALEDLAKEIKFFLVYQNFVLTGSRLFPNNVIEVGGYHVSKPKPLTGELLKFVEQSEHGVIFVSFGSLIKPSSLNQNILNIITEALSTFPQNIVWRFDNKTLFEKYDNIYVSDWLPQNDILGHPKTLAFYSHCGNLGTTEAIHHGVPMVGMPILGDQPANAASIEESGLGVQIQFRDLTKDNLINAFKKVLHPKFREQVTKLSSRWHDRPTTPMFAAVYWTEFAAKYSNVTFRTPAADVPLYQYLCLDVACVLTVVVLLLLFVLKYTICKCCIKRNQVTTINAKRPKKKSKRE